MLSLKTVPPSTGSIATTSTAVKRCRHIEKPDDADANARTKPPQTRTTGRTLSHEKDDDDGDDDDDDDDDDDGRPR